MYILLGLAVDIILFCVWLAVEAERGHYEPAKEPTDAPVGVGYAQRGALLRPEPRHVRKQAISNSTLIWYCVLNEGGKRGVETAT